MPLDRKRKVIFVCIVLFFFLVVLLVFGEIFLRTASVEFDHATSQAAFKNLDERAGITRIGTHPDSKKKHDLIYNQFGLRDQSPHRGEKAPGTYRIAMVGDSFVECLGLPWKDTVAANLEKDLKGRGVNAEVLNLGVSGYGTKREVDLCHKLLPKLSSDLVLLFWFNNDLINTVQEIQGDTEIKFRLLQRSYMFQFLRTRYETLAGKLWDKKNKIYKLQMLYLPYFVGGDQDPKIRRALDATAGQLSDLKKLCEQLGAKLVLVPVPNAMSFSELTNRSSYAEISYGVDKPLKDFLPGLAYFLMTKMAVSLQIDVYPYLFLDFKDKVEGNEMVSVKTRQKLYFVNDPHWNENGTKLAAESLSNWLVAQELVDQKPLTP